MAKKRVGANRKRTYVDKKKKIGKKVKGSVRGFLITTLIVAAIGALFFGGIKGYSTLKMYIDNSAYLSVKKVVVEGAFRSTVDSIQLRSSLIPGMKLYAIAEKKIASAIEKDIWIDKVEIKRRLNGLVYIKVKERKPIAIVNIGEIQCVDRSGVLLPFNIGTLIEMPLFIGLKDSVDAEGRGVIVKRDLNRLLAFLDDTKKFDTMNEIVSQVDFSKSDRIRLSCRASKVLLEIDSNRAAESLEWLGYIEPVLSEQDGKPALINMMYQDLAFVIQSETAKVDILKSVND